MSFDEQPDGDIHGERAAEIHRLEQELTIERGRSFVLCLKLMEKSSEKVQLTNQLDACRPYLKEGETAADALIRMQKEITTLRNAAMRLWGDRSICDKEDAARYRWLLEHPTFAVHCFIYLPGHVSAEIDKELAAHEVDG